MQTDLKTVLLDSVNDELIVDVRFASRCGFQLPSGLTGTVTFEGSVDGSNFVALSVTPLAGGSAVTSTTAAGAWFATNGVAELKSVKVKCSAFTSGSATMTVTPAVTSR